MTPEQTVQVVIGAGTLASALGMYLLLPRGGARGRAAGVVLALVGLGLFGSRLACLGDWISNSVFGVLGFVTVVSAAAAVTVRNPIYSAIWFALSLLGTAGLFMYQGAVFLGVATIVVYAGAILVTFLFVLMLAQPEGHAFYDRLSWESLLSSVTGALLVGVLTLTVASVFTQDKSPQTQVTDAARGQEILAKQHMAHLGTELFTRHLISVEIAGTLLLVALVGTVAIVSLVPRAPARNPQSATPQK